MTLYPDDILDHYRNPRHFGCRDELVHTHESKRHNPSCGDQMYMRLRVKHGVIEHICFTGVGCALSTAAASLITEAVEGKNISEVRELQAQDILTLLQIPVTPVRMKCALIGYEALQECVNSASTK